MSDSINTDLKAIHEGIGRVLLYLQDGQQDTEGIHEAMLALQSFSVDLRAISERLRYQAGGQTTEEATK